MQHHIRHAVWFRYTFAERLSHRSKSPTSPPHMETVPPKHPQHPHYPRVDFGVLLPLVLLVFYGDFLRFLLSILGFPDLKISVFFAFDFPKAAETLDFLAPSRSPYLPSNSAEFGNSIRIEVLSVMNQHMGSNPPISAKLSLSIRELHIGVVREFICPPLFLRLFSNTPLEKLHSVVLDAVFLLLFLLFSKQLSHHCQHIEISKTQSTQDWK